MVTRGRGCVSSCGESEHGARGREPTFHIWLGVTVTRHLIREGRLKDYSRDTMINLMIKGCNVLQIRNVDEMDCAGRQDH